MREYVRDCACMHVRFIEHACVRISVVRVRMGMTVGRNT